MILNSISLNNIKVIILKKLKINDLLYNYFFQIYKKNGNKIESWSFLWSSKYVFIVFIQPHHRFIGIFGYLEMVILNWNFHLKILLKIFSLKFPLKIKLHYMNLENFQKL